MARYNIPGKLCPAYEVINIREKFRLYTIKKNRNFDDLPMHLIDQPVQGLQEAAPRFA